MRQALNENPVVQAAVIGIVGVAFAVIFFMQMGGGGSDSGSSSAADPLTTPPAATTAATPDAAVAPDATATPETTAAPDAAATPAVPPASSAATGPIRPGQGIPADVLSAYRANKAIALLVVDPKGAASPLVERSTKRLAKRRDAAVFVVGADRIARYARITSGLPVTRVPALVVIRPRKLSGKQPTASVSYGFRGPASVRQALDDALYKGGKVPPYPFRDRH